MEENEWLTTEPDTVDGLPQLKVNLILEGKPLHPNKDEKDLNEYEAGIQALLGLLRPVIYDVLLERVRRLLNSPDIMVSDVFLRRYGQDVVINGCSRDGMAAHYDGFFVATAMIAMDDIAAEGTNGLYTTATSSGQASDHVSLRRYFPLQKGDGMIYTWDVMHGVDIVPGLDRTSLIVGFSTKEALFGSEPVERTMPPWLFKRSDLETNDVLQYAMARHAENVARFQADDDEKNALLNDALDFYLDSASRGNVFAQMRLGALFDSEALSPETVERTAVIVQSFGTPADLLRVTGGDVHRSEGDETPSSNGVAQGSWLKAAAQMATNPFRGDARRNNAAAIGRMSRALARHFWLEAALQGNLNAQEALGAALSTDTDVQNSEDRRRVADVLLELASQQNRQFAQGAGG
eukprot:gnl/TRDRNA2_/TRDRNA2_49038_c1_seq1.p1 gnl/TRDRNA2_/TRDRNA2_49038_c1~~gnl/TRDRNA2_/TRDRNA2_49038_c1_seq1.p1  ORF type:complete len:425 (-),score=62.72 gnl/TRDRNA2_/TRDRNA2_49038_c1_seq1:6-1226(-)